MGLGQFRPQILALQEETNAVRTCEPLRIGQKQGQGGQGPGCYHVMGAGGQLFDPDILDRHGQAHALGGGFEEVALLGGGLMQGDGQVRPQRRQHQPREAGSGPQIGQGAGIFGDQGPQLGGIPEMPTPQVGQGASGHQIVPCVPVGQQIGIGLQPGQCFT